MSTPASRKAARDYWTSPRAVRIGKIWDWTKALALAAGVMLAGSLNF